MHITKNVSTYNYYVSCLQLHLNVLSQMDYI